MTNNIPIIIVGLHAMGRCAFWSVYSVTPGSPPCLVFLLPTPRIPSSSSALFPLPLKHSSRSLFYVSSPSCFFPVSALGFPLLLVWTQSAGCVTLCPPAFYIRVSYSLQSHKLCSCLWFQN